MTMTTQSTRPSAGPSPSARPPGPSARPPAPSARAGMAPTIDPIRVVLQHLWLLVGSLVVGVALGVAAHIALLFIYPQYTAEAFYAVNVPTNDPMQIAPQMSQQGSQTALLQNTEAINMTSQSVLRVAMNTEEVRNGTKWAQKFKVPGSDGLDIDAAYEDLKDRVSATPEPNSMVVRLAVTGSSADDVLRILNAIVNVYNDRLEQQKLARKTSVTAALNKQQADLDNQISGIDGNIENYIRSNNLPPSIVTDPTVFEVQQLTQTLNESKQSLAGFQAQAETFAKRLEDPTRVYTDDERALAEATRQVQEIKSQLFNLQREEQALRERLGPNHKSVLDTQAQIRAVQIRFEDEVSRVLEQNLNVQIETAQNSILALQSQVASIESGLADARARLADLNRHIEYLDTRRAEKERLLTAREDTRKQLSNAQAYADQTTTAAASLVEPASKPTVPSFPKLPVMLVLGVFLCTGLTTGVVFLRELTDQRVKGPSDISVLPNSRLLGAVPDKAEDAANVRAAELLSLEAPQGIVAESIRQIRNPILRAMDQAGHKSLLVLGATPGSGSSTITLNLAAAIASASRKTLIIDANLRRPRIADLLGLKTSPGLADVLAGAMPADQVIVGTRQENLFVIPAGSTGSRAVDRFAGGALGDLLRKLRPNYDIILIDAPAAIVAAEGQALANDADASILVVRALQEQRGLVARLIGQLRDLHADHLGVVLNGVRSAAGGYLRRNYQQMEEYHRTSAKS